MKKLFILFCIVGLLCSGWFWINTRPFDVKKTNDILVKITAGQSVSSIALSLHNASVIRSPLAFKVYAKIVGASTKLRAGAFFLRPSQSLGEIIEILETGATKQISITIPEGYTVADIDRLLASKGLGEPGAIIDCAFRCDFSTFEFLPTKPAGSRELGYGSRLEGYLFPETYFVDVGDYQPKFFIERMLGTFRSRIITPYAAEANRSGRSLSDLVIMASLLQEESRGEKEPPIVAGILWKRLASGMSLGVDATIRYALSKPTAVLTKADVDADFAYNTRVHRGLPPSPIANPGEIFFVAALRPIISTYWYYLHGNDGRIHYAVTNDEHNVNRARYLR